MTKQTWLLLYVLLMIIVIVGVDLLFFKDRFWARVDGEHWNRPGFRCLLLEVPEISDVAVYTRVYIPLLVCATPLSNFLPHLCAVDRSPSLCAVLWRVANENELMRLDQFGWPICLENLETFQTYLSRIWHLILAVRRMLGFQCSYIQLILNELG